MEDLEVFSQEINGMVQSLDEKLKVEFTTFERKCMASNDVDKFVTCMEKTIEKIESQKKNLEFRMAFLQHNTMECLKRYQNKKPELEKCKESTRSAGANYIDLFLLNIRQ